MTAEYLLKVAVIQGVALGLYHLLLASTTLHHLKRWYLLGSLLLAFVIPGITVQTIVLPGISTVSLPPEILPDLLPVAPLPETVTSSWPGLLMLLYLAGVGVGALRFLRSYWLIIRQGRTAIHCQEREGALWYALDAPVAIHSFGRRIFYNVHQPPSPEVRAHELAHVYQYHSCDRLFIRTLSVLWWFNPMLLLFERAIIHNHELLADTAAISSLKLSPRRYQLALLATLSGKRRTSPLSSYLPFSFTKKRFLMLQQPLTTSANSIARLGLTSLAWIGLLLAFGHTAYAQEVPPPPPPPAPAAAPPAPPAAPAAPLAPPAPPSSAPTPPAPAPPAPPAPPAAPCPPPPIPTLEHLKPFLDITYLEYLKVWFRKEGEQYTDCTPYGNHGEIDSDTKVRDWFLKQQKSRLLRLTEQLQPITPAEQEAYLDPSAYGIWLDGKRIDNATLKDYPRTKIFRLLPPSKLYKNARNYGKHTYHLTLVSQENVDQQVAALRKDIAFLEGR